mmetsp:Transcript_34842/g.99459  ORF Transcript_34842/g.99459 Transcript_34842/m.99459 type:complete len:275 (-) Transcript_34842:800-1624(-)
MVRDRLDRQERSPRVRGRLVGEARAAGGAPGLPGRGVGPGLVRPRPAPEPAVAEAGTGGVQRSHQAPVEDVLPEAPDLVEEAELRGGPQQTADNDLQLVMTGIRADIRPKYDAERLASSAAVNRQTPDWHLLEPLRRPLRPWRPLNADPPDLHASEGGWLIAAAVGHDGPHRASALEEEHRDNARRRVADGIQWAGHSAPSVHGCICPGPEDACVATSRCTKLPQAWVKKATPETQGAISVPPYCRKPRSCGGVGLALRGTCALGPLTPGRPSC